MRARSAGLARARPIEPFPQLDGPARLTSAHLGANPLRPSNGGMWRQIGGKLQSGHGLSDLQIGPDRGGGGGGGGGVCEPVDA
jgi:hypothetical protein